MGRFLGLSQRRSAKWGWRHFTCLLLLSLALVAALATMLVATSSALTLPTATNQLQPTIAAGWFHSLAVKVVIGADGSLWTWGKNEDQQLGDGSTVDRHKPTHIGASTAWAAVAGGASHSLALQGDGSLWVWGDNYFGQLGDGTTDDRLAPTRIGLGTDWRLIAAGAQHSLAIRSDGSLWAWGRNDDGQLGDGTTDDRLVPARIGTDTDWVAVAAGNFHSLALKSDGTLWAWGLNGNGPLGDGTTTGQLAPVQVGTADDWAAMAAGSYHSLAIKTDGSLWAWGWNHQGQLGDDTITDRLVPNRVGLGTDWVAVAGGDSHSLGLRIDGSVWAWGNNWRGALGDGTTEDRHVPTRIAKLPGDYVAIAAGSFHSLALRSDGQLWAWGDNRFGQIGDNSTTDRLAPVPVLTGVRLPSTAAVSPSTTWPATTITTWPVTTITTLSGGFPDVPASHPYRLAIAHMAALGIINGYEDGTFGADRLVLRKHFAKMIVGAMGLPVSEGAWQDADPPFSDCGPDDPTSTYPHDFIAVAKAYGLTQGKTATTFAPNTGITRAQMVTMVVRAAQNSGVDLDPLGVGYSGLFEDYADPTHAANVKLAEYNGLLEGLVVSGTPSTWMAGDATRGEVAQVLWNLILLREE